MLTGPVPRRDEVRLYSTYAEQSKMNRSHRADGVRPECVEGHTHPFRKFYMQCVKPVAGLNYEMESFKGNRHCMSVGTVCGTASPT